MNAAESGPEVAVRWLGHASVALDIGETRILTDPLLRRHVGALRRQGPAPDRDHWDGAAAVLLSHLHLDHADVPSLRRLSGAPVLGSAAVSRWAAKAGLASRALDDQWSPVTADSDIEVRLVRAVHHSRPMPHRRNDAHGFLLRTADTAIWFAGDTAPYPELAQLGDLAEREIDLALLPIHGWGPRLSPGHLDPAGAVDVARLVGARRVLPIHHGTFHPIGMGVASLDWMRSPLRTFEAEMAEQAPGIEVLEPFSRYRPRPG